ncbi:Protein of unknown function (DUF493) [Seminavis robusta]|uniref:DUF493 domain-containing protein n=1 Tax=Seminavis robusta TaxID=568900 RepID=A0A9N8HEM3_9STRA|nr:Protein of unknown function (DUF493) [Seminavis robusta]|eukprot:Sro310_g114090.1 Protein of unknown function (DUF493) (258) ;mRNA; r:41929-42702
MMTGKSRSPLGMVCAIHLLCVATEAFLPSHSTSTRGGVGSLVVVDAKPSGTFFNPVPSEDNDNNDNDNDKKEEEDLEESLQRLLKQRNAPSLASQPSTINGVPTSQAGVGFGGFSVKKGSSKDSKMKKPSKPYIGIGEPDNNKPLNDVTKPEYDDQGYTLYADEETGEKSRVFEALVEYPCDFTMKIVGANEGAFVEEMLAVVAESCEVDDSTSIQHSTRTMGKWTSVTVHAPVKSAQMLYQLYENVDRDPRVKFKF